MARDPTPTWCFSVVLVRRGAELLMVQERKHEQRWYFPAGMVERGETFAAAAVRETQEEAGVDVQLDGILRVEHTPAPDGTARCRVFFVAHPTGSADPKRTADEHSLQAAWATAPALDGLALRGEEVKVLARQALAGGQVFPLSLLVAEGEPFPDCR